mmetsp:Transcript_5288/g.17020  ORF Transcript_5288/g.17020 Transcript_5288/m.17020 type:complete len:442 (+) Transcript_5288:671-1996(+)
MLRQSGVLSTEVPLRSHLRRLRRLLLPPRRRRRVRRRRRLATTTTMLAPAPAKGRSRTTRMAPCRLPCRWCCPSSLALPSSKLYLLRVKGRQRWHRVSCLVERGCNLRRLRAQIVEGGGGSCRQGRRQCVPTGRVSMGVPVEGERHNNRVVVRVQRRLKVVVVVQQVLFGARLRRLPRRKGRRVRVRVAKDVTVVATVHQALLHGPRHELLLVDAGEAHARHAKVFVIAEASRTQPGQAILILPIVNVDKGARSTTCAATRSTTVILLRLLLACRSLVLLRDKRKHRPHKVSRDARKRRGRERLTGEEGCECREREPSIVRPRQRAIPHGSQACANGCFQGSCVGQAGQRLPWRRIPCAVQAVEADEAQNARPCGFGRRKRLQPPPDGKVDDAAAARLTLLQQGRLEQAKAVQPRLHLVNGELLVVVGVVGQRTRGRQAVG